MTQKTDRYTISLSDCLEDIAENFTDISRCWIRFSTRVLIYAESEYSQIPSFVLVPLMFEAINDLIEEFSTNPEKYISDRLRQKIDEAVSEYLAT